MSFYSDLPQREAKTNNNKKALEIVWSEDNLNVKHKIPLSISYLSFNQDFRSLIFRATSRDKYNCIHVTGHSYIQNFLT